MLLFHHHCNYELLLIEAVTKQCLACTNYNNQQAPCQRTADGLQIKKGLDLECTGGFCLMTVHSVGIQSYSGAE